MRTLHADLITAQQSASRTPYLSVVFKSRDRGTTRTYTTTDSPNRVRSVQQLESWFDEDKGSLDVTNSGLPISGIVRLDDSDQAINVLDFEGYRCDIFWGFNTGAVNRASNGPPMFVAEQRSISLEGIMHVELLLMSLWDLLRVMWQKQTTTVRIKYKKDVSVRHILMELLGGTVPDAAVLLELGVGYTSYNAAAINPTDGSDLGSANDVALMVNPASNESGEVTNGDSFYLGLATEFNTISIDLTTPGVGTWTTQVEYWNGSAWTAVSGEADGTTSLTFGFLKTITFDKPTNWAAQNLNGTDAAFPDSSLYYVKIRVLTWSSTTTVPLATKIVLGHDLSISLDSDVAGQGDDDKPEYSSDYAQSITSAVHEVLAESLLVVYVRQDGFHIKHVDATLTPIDYTYNSAHVFNVGALRSGPIIPNKITYTNVPPGSVDTRYSGSDTDTDSETAIGTITEIIVDDSITSDAVAVTRAERAIKRLKRNGSQGAVLAPMNVGQEIWDVVRVQDSRSGKTYDGRVSRILRIYEPGTYTIDIQMGDVEFEWTPQAAWNRFNRPGSWRALPPRERQSIQAETWSSSGKWTAGDGAVVIDESGILFNAQAGGMLVLEGGGRKDVTLYNDQVGTVAFVESGAGVSTDELYLAAFNVLKLDVRTHEDGSRVAYLVGDSTPWALVINGSVQPLVDSYYGLGSSTKAWSNGYLDKIWIDNIEAFTAAGRIALTSDIEPGADNTIAVGAKSVTKSFNLGSFYTIETDQIAPISGTTINVQGIMRSTPGGPWDFGTATNYFAAGYINEIFTTRLRPRTGSDIDIYSNLDPSAGSTWRIGQSGLRFSEIWGDEVRALLLVGTDIDLIGDITMLEIAAPAAPGVNQSVLYTVDNGAGKTQLAVRFNTGAVQVLATQP